MISEKQLSDGFDSFWQNHFPMLDTTCIRRFNSQMSERIPGSNGRERQPIPMGEDIERFDLVAEIAFEMARAYYEKKQGREVEVDFSRPVRKVAALEGHVEIVPPHPHEIAEAEALLTMYIDFFDGIASSKELRFTPKIRGIGIVDAMEGDFCSSETLYEVKCVNRNLQSSDLRQVLCYLVAGLASDDYQWQRYCIFNPRRGVHYSGRIDQLLVFLSGRTPNECINEVIDSLMEREQILEIPF